MAVKKRSGMHRADIVAALRKSNTSLSQLGIQNNLSKYTLKNALDKPYSRGEKIIADALGMRPEDIWPDRY
ncbi:transcriptional regulator [Salmonella enterica]|nr:transcriptional regulator [Salmonella enterica]EBY3036492.1 transcriptional regulator [Salmonella enterica subsp. enterica serovar Thompson]ECA5645120.1 transcriptional regulator [Salmonella enterica subsp. enterica serovar Saintpaul]ECG8541302.1 transcriptional regulator [Salmonella enterica]ECL1314208.1 transcriptional regulator [Salmonella enterica]